MRWWFFESLHAKVLFAAFIPGVIVLAVVAIIAQFAYERTARMLVEQRDAELACMSAAQLNNGLDQRSSVLETIANDAFVQALDLDGVRLVLDRVESQTQDFDGGVAANGREAVEKAQGLSPDVILMDLRMPEMTGVDAMRAISERDPEAKIIVLTTYDTDEYIFDAIEAGAKDYLLKDTSHEELFSAVRGVPRGASQIEPGVAAKVLTRLAQLSRQSFDPIRSSDTLSDREVEVLQLIARGSANKQIGADLSTSESTVKTHVANIFQKLDVSHRDEAVSSALQRGIIKL